MNIFVLDANPVTAARFHNDRHCVKMILESCQLLATAHHVADKRMPAGVNLRPTHVNHPCARWLRSDPAHYHWLHTLCGALLIEYSQRYSKAHSYTPKWEALWVPPVACSSLELRTWPVCMPDECKVPRATLVGQPGVWDPVASYRMYYWREKQHLATWYRGDKTKVPPWWKQMMKENKT